MFLRLFLSKNDKTHLSLLVKTVKFHFLPTVLQVKEDIEIRKINITKENQTVPHDLKNQIKNQRLILPITNTL